jgi:hypothetical protein
MGLFSKKKRDSDEIPRLPELPDSEEIGIPSSDFPEVPSGLPDIETRNLGEINSLPIIPGSETGGRFDQEIVKQTINSPSANPINRSIKIPKISPRTIQPSISSGEVNIQDKEHDRSVFNTSSKISSEKEEPVYIRLDKFNLTVDTFEEIKAKIIEIEDTLRNIREIKEREEKELQEWETEIHVIKSRIDAVDRNIFSKLD